MPARSVISVVLICLRYLGRYSKYLVEAPVGNLEDFVPVALSEVPKVGTLAYVTLP